MNKIWGNFKLYKGLKSHNWFYASLCLVSFCLASCQEDLGSSNGGGQELNPGEVFDFATSQDVQMNVSYNVTPGYEVAFEAYTQNPVSLVDKSYVKDTTLIPFFKGYTDKSGNFSLPLTNLPAFVEDVYLYSLSIDAPRVIHGKIQGNTLNITDEDVVINTRAVTKGSPNGSYYTKWPVQNLAIRNFGTFDAASGRPSYVLDEKLAVSAQTKRIIDATLPDEGVGEMNPYGYLNGDISISEDAHIDLYFYYHNSERQNGLAYYTYSGTTAPTQEYINEHLILAYPNLKNMKEGEGIRLKYYDESKGEFADAFPANTTIGFVLLVDAYEDLQADAAGYKANKVNVAYSIQTYNRYNMKNTIMSDRPHSAIFRAPKAGGGEKDGDYILAFEDQPWGQSNKPNGQPDVRYPADFRDDILVIHADPVTAFPDVPDGQDPDQVPGKAFRRSTGTLCFEDLWPYRGDYDLNDIVVKYDVTDYITSDYISMTGFEGDFVFANDGAERLNGFGFQLKTVDRTNIASIEITSDYTCPGQGLDPDLEKATIMLFDNGKQVPDETKVAGGTSFHVKVVYNQPVPFYQYQLAPYNPFIVVNSSDLLASNRAELHLVNYLPTQKANLDMLHTGDDLSNPDKGLYYVLEGDYPFTLNLSGVTDFVLPTEKQRIDEAYPKFKTWVSSKGSVDKDWYVK